METIANTVAIYWLYHKTALQKTLNLVTWNFMQAFCVAELYILL